MDRKENTEKSSGYKIGYFNVVRIAICDDEETVLDIMLSAIRSAFAKRGVQLEIETFLSVEPLRRSMLLRAFDLLFLDIEIPSIDGIEFATQLRKDRNETEIIFVSGREDRVFDTFKVRPFDFIRKSNFLHDLGRVIDSYLDKLAGGKSDLMTVHGKNGYMNIPVLSIMWIEGRGKMQSIHMDDKRDEINIYSSMEKLSSEFSEKGFLRIHKGILVNYRYISRIFASEIELTDGTRLPISRRKAAEMKTRYFDLLRRDGSYTLS